MSIILATWESETGMIIVLGQPKQKSFWDSISIEKIWVCWYIPVTTAMVGVLKSENHGPGKSGQKVQPYYQENQSKKGWRLGLSGRVSV
jgi:hypothetical protein